MKPSNRRRPPPASITSARRCLAGLAVLRRDLPDAPSALASRLRRASGDSGEMSRTLGRLDAQARPRGSLLPLPAPALDEAGELGIVGGTSTIRVTSWSPRWPLLAVKPLPLRRSTLPELEPLGTLSITGPSTVGTLTLAPSTASSSATGRSSRILSPSRRKKRCGLIAMVTIASPLPPGPGWPWPARRILVPSSTPGGSLMSSVLPLPSVTRWPLSARRILEATRRADRRRRRPSAAARGRRPKPPKPPPPPPRSPRRRTAPRTGRTGRPPRRRR